jgi:hypothetical protein
MSQNAEYYQQFWIPAPAPLILVTIIWNDSIEDYNEISIKNVTSEG